MKSIATCTEQCWIAVREGELRSIESFDKTSCAEMLPLRLPPRIDELIFLYIFRAQSKALTCCGIGGFQLNFLHIAQAQVILFKRKAAPNMTLFTD